MKTKFKLILVAGALALAVAGCGGGGQQAQPPANNGGGATADAGAAEELYKANCLACHGGNLEGVVGPKLSDVGARLGEADIATVIKNGRGGMPAQSQLSDDQVNQLAAWLAAKK